MGLGHGQETNLLDRLTQAAQGDLPVLGLLALVRLRKGWGWVAG